MPDAGQTLAQIVDVFACCLFTWKALVTVVPAFILAGAISAFMPKATVLQALGTGASKLVAYPVAAVSGIVLSLCSCNVVPLFLSIYRSGAGIGPASTFLFAGPAINIVSLVLVFDAIGWQMGVWRMMLVPIVAIASGLTMAAVFATSDTNSAQQQPTPVEADTRPAAHSILLFILLTALVVYGAWEMALAWKIAGMVLLAAATAVLFAISFSMDDAHQWALETWFLIKTVIPVLIPAVIVIGLVTTFIDIKFIYDNVADNSWKSIFFADVFSELMYFPILAEVVFTKAMLKLGMATGPAMAILLTGSGASLPGAVIIGRGVGWKKAVVFVLCEIGFSTAGAMLFASEIGQYICECMMKL